MHVLIAKYQNQFMFNKKQLIKYIVVDALSGMPCNI